MEPPVEPSMEDCCQSGCNPCIFDVYERKLKQFKHINENKNSEIETVKLRKNGISELSYTAFKIVGTNLLSESQKLIKFQSIKHNSPDIWWSPGDHFLYKYENINISCTRAYTPVKLKAHKDEHYDFSIVIKCYENGLVSSYLFQLKEETVTLWRGPYGSYKIKPNTYKRIVMIAQGTGIAPFISIIDRILNDEDDMTQIHLCYCCQSVQEILFREELIEYGLYWNFSYEIFVTCVLSHDSFRYQEPLTPRKLSAEDIHNLNPYSNDQFLICGSSNFMKCYRDILEKKDIQIENIVLF